MALTAEAEKLLERAVDYGVTSVYASDIVSAAALIQAGYVECRDDHEGPWLSATEEGKKHLRTRLCA